MASGSGKAFAYEERQNYIRLKSLVSLSTYVLKAMFDNTFPPEQLRCKLKQIIGTIIHGSKKNIISQKQFDLLFPQTSPPQSDKFDVSLLVYLLRHICGLDSRCKWWEEHDNSKIPDTVVGEEADIARIRNVQNEIHHLQGASMKQSEFDAKWAITEKAMLRLGTIYNLLGLKNEIETLKNQPFETVVEKIFVIMQSHGFDEEYWYDDKYDYDSETYDIKIDEDFDVADAYDDDHYDEYNEYVPDFDDENGCDGDDEPVYDDCRYDNEIDNNDDELVCDVDLFENGGYYDKDEPVYDEDRNNNRGDYKNVEPVWDENRYDNAGDNKNGKPVRYDVRYKNYDDYDFAELVGDDDCSENYDDVEYDELVWEDDCNENYDDVEYDELVWEDDCYENSDDVEYAELLWDDDCYGNSDDDDEYAESEWDEDSYESDDYYELYQTNNDYHDN